MVAGMYRTLRTNGSRQDGSQEHCSSVPGCSKVEIEYPYTYVLGAERLHSTIGGFDQDEAGGGTREK